MLPKSKARSCLAALIISTLAIAAGEARACADKTMTEITFAGDLSGKEPFRLITAAQEGKPAQLWVDDDGLPTIMTIIQVAEDKDIAPYSDLFKKSLSRLIVKAEEYRKNSDDPEAQAHYQAISKESKKFLAMIKDRPMAKKDIAVFHEKLGDPIFGAITDGVFGYELLDPSTGKPDDPEEPQAPLGYFGPALKFAQTVEGAKSKGCTTYSLKIVQPAPQTGGGGTSYMVAPGG